MTIQQNYEHKERLLICQKNWFVVAWHEKLIFFFFKIISKPTFFWWMKNVCIEKWKFLWLNIECWLLLLLLSWMQYNQFHNKREELIFSFYSLSHNSVWSWIDWLFIFEATFLFNCFHCEKKFSYSIEFLCTFCCCHYSLLLLLLSRC